MPRAGIGHTPARHSFPAREVLPVTRRLAPTRSHPTVSRRPPGNALSALPLSLLDRTRDAMDAGARRLPALAPAGRAVSRALAALAGMVELLPPSRRGDRPATSG
jgi:hypothetical protein